MPHIIDLKNRTANQQEPEDGEGLNLKKNISGLQTRTISWFGLEHRHQSDIRFVLFFSLALFGIAALVQIFQRNIITTVFFALLGIVLLMNTGRRPDEVEYEINPIGVSIHGNLHRYGEIQSFWIEYDPALGIRELSLQLKKWYTPYVKIPIEDQNPVRLRLALLEFLPEVEHKDTLVEILARKLGI